MQMCPNCGEVYDESEYSKCPNCHSLFRSLRKLRHFDFLAGVVATVLVGSLVLTAGAISGRMTIEVDPINVQVNGEVFQPTDVNGKEVPVFAYEGTTYAPLRALAEAYGLEVGYDAAANMATVSDPDAQPAPARATALDYSNWSSDDDAAYKEFKALCNIEREDGYWACEMYTITNMLDVLKEATERGFIDRLASELLIEDDDAIIFIDGVGHSRMYEFTPIQHEP